MRKHCIRMLSTYWPYVLLAAVIMGPLLVGGYVLTLDMVFGPNIAVPSSSTASYVFYGVLKGLSFIIPVNILQTIMLFLIFAVGGIGMHRFVTSLRPEQTDNWTVATYFAGVLFVVNPFVYSRFMAGQFAVLLGYTLLPFIAKALIAMYQQPSKGQAIRIGIYGALVGIVSIHTLGMVALVALAAGIAFFTRKNQKQLLKFASLAIGLFVILSSYWLLPFITGTSAQSQQVSAFTAQDTRVFATDTTNLGAMGNVLALHGFWGDNKGLYQTPQDVYGWWLLPVLALWFLVAFGGYALWRWRPRVAYGIGVLFVMSAVLAAGPHAPVTGALYRIIDYLPFFGGYREPQKFAAIIAFVYALLGAWGVAAVLARARSYWRSSEPLAVGCILLIPVFCAPLMLWGFKGQLVAATYPDEWSTVNRQIPHEATVLYLPWHHYMRYDFAGRVIASPAAKFFDAHMIYSNDPELAGVEYSQTTQQQTIQDEIIPAITERESPVVSQLRKLGVEYVILVKEHDYEQYSSLRDDPQLERIQNGDHIMTYKVKEQ